MAVVLVYMHTFTKGGARNLKAGGLHEKHAVYLLQVAKTVQAKQRTGRSVIRIAAEAVRFFFCSANRPDLACSLPRLLVQCVSEFFLEDKAAEA